MMNINEYILSQKEDAVRFLQKLISFDSTFVDQGVGGNEGSAQRWLAGQMEEWGFETKLSEPDNEMISTWPDFNEGHDYTGRPNLIAVHPGTGGGRSLMFNGHMDTVPLDDLSKWQDHPLSGTLREGKIFGRGACDMKAGVAAMILAVKYLNDLDISHHGDIIIESVVDEEGGGNGTLACVAEGYKADAAIVTEPTGLQMYCASRGVFLLKVEVSGKPSHACFKWNGVNAIEKAIKIAEGLKELETRWLATRKNPLLPSPTITLGQIEGGISAATVPGNCTMRFDVKYLPYEIDGNGNKVIVKSEEIKEEVAECIRRVCQADPWLEKHPAKLEWYLSVMPHSIDIDHPLIGVAAKACDEVLGKHMISGLPSGADARHLQNNGNIPTILFGPGNMKNAHSINEYVDVDEFLEAIQILARIIMEWTNT